MDKYYKLSVLRETKQGAALESFYLEISKNKSKIVLYTPGKITGKILNSRLERITKEEINQAIFRHNLDRSHS